MPTVLNLKKLLHRPQFELCNPSAVINAAGSLCRSLKIPAYHIDHTYFAVNGTTSIYAWDPVADTEVLLPASGLAGTFGAGACGRIHPMGPNGTATAGSATTLTTNLTIPRDLRGYRIRITGGPGAGDERVITSNTLGANSVITTAGFSATITASSTYVLLTPRFWVINPSATPGFGYWDFALSAWTAGRSVTGITITGTDGALAGTAAATGNKTDASDCNGNAALTTSTTTVLTLASSSPTNSGRSWVPNEWIGAVVQIIAGTAAGQTRLVTANAAGTLTVGTAFGVAPDATSVWQLTKAFASSGSNSAVFSACTTTVLTLTGVNWTTNQWANAQIRAISGTGAGQVRTIASNTSVTLTVSAAMTAFDATTIWVIEGNDNDLYLIGNAAVAMFKYSISGNSWVTAAAGAARAGAPGAGAGFHWITGVVDVSGGLWGNENAIRNGRFLYSFRAGASAALDIYDLALATWESGRVYGNLLETFTTGSSFEYDGTKFIFVCQAATGRFFYFDILMNELNPLCEHAFTSGAAIVGDKLMAVPFFDGSTRVTFLYQWVNTSTAILRTAVWHI